MADTNGEGVDIVLNTLTGAGFIESSLNCLAPNGYFMEISKRDVWTDEQMAAAHPGVSYFLVDLVEEGQEYADLIQEMLQDLMPLSSEKHRLVQKRRLAEQRLEEQRLRDELGDYNLELDD